MRKLVVKTDTSSLEQWSSKAITGVIFFDFGNYQFPEEGWNDFIVVVLSWWITALRSIDTGHSKSEELNFMDGPLYVNLEKRDEGLCFIECCDRRSENKIKFSGQYMQKDILESVLRVAKSVCSACSNKKWKSDDIEILEKLVQDYSK